MTAAVPARWCPAPEVPEHPLARVDMVEVGQGVKMLVELGPRTRDGGTAFRVMLHAEGLGRTREPVLHGVHHPDRRGVPGGIEVTHLQARVPVRDGDVDLPEGIAAQILLALGALVPAGGHLVAVYESEALQQTALALDAGVPPEATPLGAMMFSAGCGIALQDLHASDGARGARRLRGMRALDEAHAVRRAAPALAALEAFMGRSKHLDWGLQVTCRPLAEQVMGVLRERLGLGAGPVPLDIAERVR
ncbi:MAG: hypothetical protein AMXMBFR23_13080 [Chloroflexota bacterium]